MNRESYLKLRLAWRLAEELAGDKEAQALLAELRLTRTLLKDNEVARPVPESREFYWSKIEQAIRRAERDGETREATPWWVAWRRFLAPAAAVALVTGVTLFTATIITPPGTDDAGRSLPVVENLSEHTESFTFRSPSENMFVVWIHTKDDAQPSESDSEPLDDMVY